MSRLHDLRDRIHAVENIDRITRTLATVAAARLSRSRRRAAGMREYAARFRDILRHEQAHLAARGLAFARYSDLLQERPAVQAATILLITADRGMCGGYNLEACRVAQELAERLQRRGRRVSFAVIGRKGERYLLRRKLPIVHRARWEREGVSADGVEALLQALIARYRAGETDVVHVVYTQFFSALRREARSRRLLPMVLDVARDGPPAADEAADVWHYEPGYPDVVSALLEVYLGIQLSGMLLESHSSEQGARMVTMEEATERAEKALVGYRVQLHRLRRETITLDLLGALYASRAIALSSTTGARSP